MEEAESPPITHRSHSDHDSAHESSQDSNQDSSQESVQETPPVPPKAARPSKGRPSLERSMSRRSLDRSAIFDEPVTPLNVYANKDDLLTFSAMKRLRKPKGPRSAYALFMSDYRKLYPNSDATSNSTSGSFSSNSSEPSKKLNDLVKASVKSKARPKNGHVNGIKGNKNYRDDRLDFNASDSSSSEEGESDDDDDSENEQARNDDENDQDDDDDTESDISADEKGSPPKRNGNGLSPNDSVLSPSKFTIGDFSRVCSRHWKSLPESERNVYFQRAKEDKERYERELAEFTDKMAHYSAKLAAILEESARIKD